MFDDAFARDMYKLFGLSTRGIPHRCGPGSAPRRVVWHEDALCECVFLTKLLETIDPAVLRLAAMHTCACDAKSMRRAYYKLGFELSVRVATLHRDAETSLTHTDGGLEVLRRAMRLILVKPLNRALPAPASLVTL